MKMASVRYGAGRGPERGQGQGMAKKTPRPRPLSQAGRGKGPGARVFRGPVRPVTISKDGLCRLKITLLGKCEGMHVAKLC